MDHTKRLLGLSTLLLISTGCLAATPAGQWGNEGGNTGSGEGSGTSGGQSSSTGSQAGGTTSGSTGGPQISCSPSIIGFGETLDHGISTVPVICMNSGTATAGANLVIESLTVVPDSFTALFDATHDPYPSEGLAPGQSVQIDVSYDPADTSGGTEATLYIESNANGGSTIQISIEGQGLDIPPCQFVVTPPELDFGEVQVGDTSNPLTFQVEDVGANDCFVGGILIKNDATNAFHILSSSPSPDLTTGKITIPAPATGLVSSLTVSMEFAPTEAGSGSSAEVAFSISDPSAPNQVVQLTGLSE